MYFRNFPLPTLIRSVHYLFGLILSFIHCLVADSLFFIIDRISGSVPTIFEFIQMVGRRRSGDRKYGISSVEYFEVQIIAN